MILTKETSAQGIDFNFSTPWKNEILTFTVRSAEESFAVLLDNKLIGKITIGLERHTWHVIDSNYLDYRLVKEIGQQIIVRAN
jgi:hypothetical protein